MASRAKIVAGNWKMHGSLESSVALAFAVHKGIAELSDVSVVVCPVNAHITSVVQAIKNSSLKVGVQNAHPETSGAFTGELSVSMLGDLGCEYLIVGHSERRQLFGETDQQVADKVEASLGHNITPILCVGETLEQREAGDLENVIGQQLGAVVSRVGIDAFAKAVVAYEPVWAIGTGKTASPEQAQEVHAMIRTMLSSHSTEVAASVSILYGGSVKPGNANSLFSQADIDGGLIGGAALDADSFIAICQAAAAV